MFWSKSIFTVCRPVFMPTLRSARMTGSASGFNSPSRFVSAVSVPSPSIDAVPRNISVPSRLVMPIAQVVWPGFGLFDIGLDFLALEGRVPVMRGQTAGREPGRAPDSFATRRKLG